MKIALAQLNYHIGNFEYNFQKIANAVNTAREQGADIVAFGELSVCGYPPRDFLEFSDFVERCEAVVHQICELATDIAIIVGCPMPNPKPEGKDLFNAAYFIANQKVQHIAHKALLPNYDIFDEYRYFEPAKNFEILEYKGYKIALTICEDIWNVGNENPMYTVCPLDELMPQKPDFVINISASPFNYNQAAERLHVVKANVKRYQIPMFYVNHVGAQTDLIFDGGSLVVSQHAEVVCQMPFFEEKVQTFDLQSVITQKPTVTFEIPSSISLIHKALIIGIQNYFQKLGFKKAILGLSGGIDSAIVLALACEALGSKNVLSVLMPSEFSSDHSVNDSLQMVKNLQAPYELISIQKPFEAYLQTLDNQFKNTEFGISEENLQARIRATILMAMSNKFGYILLNTSNKSEAAVGYGTLYGDMCGALGVIGDLYKTQVYALANYINSRHTTDIIPQNIIHKAPSAELRPNQKDSDSLPDYAILDQILHAYIELRKSPRQLIEVMGFDKNLINRVLKMVNGNEFKRWQAPPILRVSGKAFGLGRRMPLEGKYLS